MKTLKHKKLEWTDPSKEQMTWIGAIEYCKTLGDGWRLPTIKELHDITSYKKTSPCLKKKFIKRFNVITSGIFWSSTTFVSNTSYVWGISLNFGNLNNHYKISNCYVWPVRDINQKIKPVNKLYGVIEPNHRIPSQIHHSLERLKKVNDVITEYKIVEYRLNEK